MTLSLGIRGLGLGRPLRSAALPYYQRVLATKPANLIGYWPLWEAAGLVAHDISGNGRNGTFDGTVTVGQEGIGDGKTCVTQSGGTGTVFYSAGLAGAFNGAAGAASFWLRAGNAVIWSNTTDTQYLCRMIVDAGNGCYFYTWPNANYSYGCYYHAGGTLKQVAVPGLLGLDWAHVAMTWSKASDRMRVFINGTQVLPQQTGLGVWAGALPASTCKFGVAGCFMAHLAVWSAELTPAEIYGIGPNTAQVICDGDSRTNGKFWPGQALVASGKRYGLGQFGNSGVSLANMIVNAPANVDPLLRAGTKNILVVWGGVNDLADAATTHQHLADYCAARRAAGWNKIIVCTEIDAQDAARNGEDWHGTIYPALNTLIRANYASYADGLADLGANANLQNANNATYFSDKLHPTAAGDFVIGSIVGPAIAGV